MKNNKQPGPDGIIMELYKYMYAQNRAFILQILKDWWTNVNIPQELFIAKVISPFKKGDTYNIEKYRPISLLNSFFTK